WTGSLPLSSMVLLRRPSIWSRPGPVAMYAPIATPTMPPRMNQPKPPPFLSSAIAFSSSYRANQTFPRHPHAVHGRFHATAESGHSAPTGPEPDIYPRRDVVHILDGLSHLGQC